MFLPSGPKGREVQILSARLRNILSLQSNHRLGDSAVTSPIANLFQILDKLLGTRGARSCDVFGGSTVDTVSPRSALPRATR